MRPHGAHREGLHLTVRAASVTPHDVAPGTTAHYAAKRKQHSHAAKSGAWFPLYSVAAQVTYSKVACTVAVEGLSIETLTTLPRFEADFMATGRQAGGGAAASSATASGPAAARTTSATAAGATLPSAATLARRLRTRRRAAPRTQVNQPAELSTGDRRHPSASGGDGSGQRGEAQEAPTRHLPWATILPLVDHWGLSAVITSHPACASAEAAGNVRPSSHSGSDATEALSAVGRRASGMSDLPSPGTEAPGLRGKGPLRRARGACFFFLF